MACFLSAWVWNQVLFLSVVAFSSFSFNSLCALFIWFSVALSAFSSASCSSILLTSGSRRWIRCRYFFTTSVGMNELCFRPRFCTVKLYWAGEKIGEWDEFCYESFPWYRIDRLTCWPTVQRITTMTSVVWKELHFNKGQFSGWDSFQYRIWILIQLSLTYDKHMKKSISFLTIYILVLYGSMLFLTPQYSAKSVDIHLETVHL